MFSFTLNMTQRLTATDVKKKRPNKMYWWNKFMLDRIPQSLKDDWTIYLVNVRRNIFIGFVLKIF